MAADHIATISRDFNFSRNSTTEDVLEGQDLTGKTALITGANSGIGFETARSLAIHNCEIIFGCRNEKLAQEAIQKIRDVKEDAKYAFIKLDLSTLGATKHFCDQVKNQFHRIDYLILNAGFFPGNYCKSADNLELAFQVMHLSHFYLTLELSDLLDFESRVIVVSSAFHKFSRLPAYDWTEDHLNPTHCNYSRISVYNNNKLFNVMFAKELSRRWKSRGISVISCDPGCFISTNISKEWWLTRFLFRIARPFAKNLKQAAATIVYCATFPDLSTSTTGCYFKNCNLADESDLAKNEALAAILWKFSEQFVKQILNSQRH